MTASELPLPWRNRLDWFELTFLYGFLPLVVSTMARPRYLGGILLLWLVAWFFIRRLPQLPEGGDVLRRWMRSGLVAAAGVLLAGGAALAFGQSLARAGGALLGLVAVVLPATALCLAYLPLRLRDSEWIASWARPVVPALALAGLHLATARWEAVLLAFAVGWLVMRRWLPQPLALVVLLAPWSLGVFAL